MSKITLQTIDQHLNDESLALIDIREITECAQEGMIKGFNIIPFHTTLNAGTAFYPLDSTFDTWYFENEHTFKKHFPKDKTLVLLCRAGNRTRALEKALRYLGYKAIIDLGGIIDYKGDNLTYYKAL
ncbi:MAG: rhodanese-like domain-containing protein [Candidatus Izemoplasmataceae bacterium]